MLVIDRECPYSKAFGSREVLTKISVCPTLQANAPGSAGSTAHDSRSNMCSRDLIASPGGAVVVKQRQSGGQWRLGLQSVGKRSCRTIFLAVTTSATF